MSFFSRYLFPLTSVLALAASACSANPSHLARSSAAPMTCAGGVIQTTNDAARFAGCTAVTGNLLVARTQLSDLTALQSLRSVSGTLAIADNAQLDDVSGLEQLTSVGGLEIRNNPDLRDVSGLSALRRAGAVKIRHNHALKSLRGLEGLEQVEELELVNNGLFETSGLVNLREVGNLTIADNSKLISLRGLNGLTQARSVHIRNNRVLCAQLGLLPKLGRVSHALVVSSNRSVSQREVESLREHVKLLPLAAFEANNQGFRESQGPEAELPARAAFTSR